MSGTIRVHIDELILVGIRPGDRDAVAAALTAELSRLLRGTPLPGARGEPIRGDRIAAPPAGQLARADARSVGRLAAAQVHSSLRGAW